MLHLQPQQPGPTSKNDQLTIIRIDAGTADLLAWFEAVLGKPLWDNLIVDSTFRSESEVEIERFKSFSIKFH